MLSPCAHMAPGIGAFTASLPRRAKPSLPKASSSASSNTEAKSKPSWAGDDSLSRLVNAAISFPPLFSVMKVAARGAMKSTAEKKGVPWSNNVATLEASEVYSIKAEVEDPSLAYPSYYTKPFHGYDEGNLNWLAAFEVEPATQVMALRVWKTEELTPLEAQTRLRRGIFDGIRSFTAAHGLQEPHDVLDIGCSVGVSSRWLAAEYPSATVTGLDLSPHFLAVAEFRERQQGGDAGQRPRIKYLHANMESTGLPAASYDLVTVQFVIHECPAAVIANLVAEARRLLRPGGVLAIADNNPRSPVIQGLPPLLFTLMKSTEPWSDEYYQYDVEACMVAAGLAGVNTIESDPRHRVVLGHL